MHSCQVEFTEPGICHGFALWIDWVMDSENSLVLSTGPGMVRFLVKAVQRKFPALVIFVHMLERVKRKNLKVE